MPDTRTLSKPRPLAPADLEAVIAMDKAATGISRRGYFEKRLAAALENPRDYVFVGLFGDDGLEGFAFAQISKGEFGHVASSASLDAIGINPNQAVAGTGRRLLDEVERILRHKGVGCLTSQVAWKQQPILAFMAREGFAMAPSTILTRDATEMPQTLEEIEEDDEIDYSSPEGDAENALSRERIPVRTMEERDLAKIIAIDTANSGRERESYFILKQEENLKQSGVRVSLVAEQDGFPVGFIMARVDYGEFGRTSPEAVMDAIGVDPGFQHQGIGHALMSRLMANLSVLRVENVRTEVAWNDTALIGYLADVGFSPGQRIALQKAL